MALDPSKYIKGIRIESVFLPDIYLPDPFKASVTPNPFLQALKPKITIESTLGDKVLTPYGEPGASMWPAIKTGLLVAGIGFMAWRILK